MRTSTSKTALIALAAAAFSLPAFAQDSSNDNAVNPPAATASPTNPAPAPSAQIDQNKGATPSAQSDVGKDNSVAAAPDTAATAMGGQRVSQLIGTSVVNDKDESIGKVDDILIGAGDKATMAVISVGGFLGIGSKLVAVPFDQLQPAANDRKSLTLPNATKDQLKSMPAFKYGQGA